MSLSLNQISTVEKEVEFAYATPGEGTTLLLAVPSALDTVTAPVVRPVCLKAKLISRSLPLEVVVAAVALPIPTSNDNVFPTCALIFCFILKDT